MNSEIKIALRLELFPGTKSDLKDSSYEWKQDNCKSLRLIYLCEKAIKG